MLYLKTLGDIHLAGARGSLSSPRKQLTLLAYLARHQPRGVSRAELADLLWGSRDQGHARQSLRQALVELKRTLDDGLLIGPERVALASGSLQTDVAELEQRITSGQFDMAVELWGGDFLSGCEDLGGESFRAWLESERQQLRQRLGNAYDQLVTTASRQGAWDSGVRWARGWIEQLPVEERAHHRLVECLQEAGRAEEAQATYTAFSVMLQTQLGVEPSPQYQMLAATLHQKTKRPVGVRSPGSAALFTPDLVGRGRVLADLRESWQQAQAGEPTTMLVEGEAGIGKTRVCDEFLREVMTSRNPPTVLQIRADDPSKTPLSLTHRVIFGLITLPGLAAASPKALSQLAHVVPELREHFPWLPETIESLAEVELGLGEALATVSEERPLILYIDDFLSADPDDRKVLKGVTRGVGSSRILFLLTARTGEEEPTADYTELATSTRCRRLKLQQLRARDVEELLTSMLQLAPAVRQRLARELHDQAGGNAFYVIELTAALVDEGLLAPDEAGTWQFTSNDQEHHLPLPRSVREVIARRLMRLSPDIRAVVNAAAVLGRTFDSRILPKLLRGADVLLPTAIEELICRRILRPARTPPGTLEFAHEIIWRVTYELLPARDRQSLHRQAVSALRTSSRWSTGTRGLIAYHRSRAGLAYRRRWLAPLLITAGVLSAVAVGTFVFTPASKLAGIAVLISRPRPTLQPRRIVVAPLTNHTGDSTLASLGTLAADWIAEGLMRTTEFEVVDPRTASMTSRVVEHIPALLRDRNRAIAIAQETQSGTVISGDLFREGDSLRALVQITDVETGKIVRAVDPVSGSLVAPSKLVSLLGDRVVTAVAAALDTTSRGFSAGLGAAPSYEAYTATSRAWESFFQDDFAEVFRDLDRASAIDSTYMTPLLMRAYVETRIEHWSAVDTLLRRIGAHSVKLTPAERAVLEVLRADLKGDLWARLRASRELMHLTPGSVEGFTLTASSALFVNHPHEALKVVEQVDPDRGLLLVAPFYWINHTAALHRLPDHRAELHSAEEGLRRFPNRFDTQINLLFALAAEGDVARLRRELRHETVDDPPPGGVRAKAFLVYRELKAHGNEAVAAHWLDDVVTQPVTAGDTTPEGLLLEGDIQSARGHWEEARSDYAEGLRRQPDDPTFLGRLGTIAAHEGQRGEARLMDSILAHLPTPYLFGRQTYARARIAAALGDRATAVELLRAAWSQGRPLPFDNFGYSDVHNDEEFVSLREYPPFQALMRTD